MFKVGKLEDINNIEVSIDTVSQTIYSVSDDKHIKYDTLSFNIGNDIYSFSFNLNCRLEELLNIEEGKTIDFKKYIFSGETMFTYNGITDIDPKYDITINRYMNNKYVVLANVFADTKEGIFSSIIEFDFNLDEYIKNTSLI